MDPLLPPDALHIGLGSEEQRELFANTFHTSIDLKNGSFLGFKQNLEELLEEKKIEITLFSEENLERKESFTFHIGQETPLYQRLQELQDQKEKEDPQALYVAKALLFKNAVMILSQMSVSTQALKVQFDPSSATYSALSTKKTGKQDWEEKLIEEKVSLPTKQQNQSKEEWISLYRKERVEQLQTITTTYGEKQKTRSLQEQLLYLSSVEKMEKIVRKFSQKREEDLPVEDLPLEETLSADTELEEASYADQETFASQREEVPTSVAVKELLQPLEKKIEALHLLTSSKQKRTAEEKLQEAIVSKVKECSSHLMKDMFKELLNEILRFDFKEIRPENLIEEHRKRHKSVLVKHKRTLNPFHLNDQADAILTQKLQQVTFLLRREELSREEKQALVFAISPLQGFLTLYEAKPQQTDRQSHLQTNEALRDVIQDLSQELD